MAFRIPNLVTVAGLRQGIFTWIKCKLLRDSVIVDKFRLGTRNGRGEKGPNGERRMTR